MDKKQVFVISPIGKKESEDYKKFDAVLKTMIKPAIDEIDKTLRILRADQISQPGSFIKDILEQLQNSYIVIANLTGLNPNVFYELGVRHSLSNRTIMITEDLSTLPSDLKEYRVIEYSAELTAIESFKEDLKKAIKSIIDNPEKSDNPVQDRLPGIISKREEQYLDEIALLREKLTNQSSKKSISKSDSLKEGISKRIDRILKLMNATSATYLGRVTWTIEIEKKKKSTEVEDAWGNFKYYFVNIKGSGFIDYSLILSIREYDLKLKDDLADIRVMLSLYGNKGMHFKYVIATNTKLNSEKKDAVEFFKKAVKKEKLLLKDNQFEIWDLEQIEKIEKQLGLK
jgi:hypothetical protein